MDDAAKAQEDVLAFLAEPATYGRADKVLRIDTHAAAVFLAGDRALKVKRAVRFPFLDFSTLEKRKRACEAEIEVNRRLAPKLYRGVVAVTRDSNGQLAIGGNGAPIEWAVDMVRFDENRTLDHLANEIDDDLADALGRAVAATHDKAPIVDAEPWIEALGAYIDEHVEAFAEHPGIFRAADIKAHAEKSRAHYQRILPLLRDRGRRGLVRRIHGDLHLGNIVLIDGQPVLFDAIEFSDIIGSGDVLYDLAFLLMDLFERKLPQAANIVLNRYLAETRRDEDLDALAALPFFLSMRAAIPKVMPGAVIVRSDIERKVLFGIAENEKLPADAYEEEVTARIYATLTEKARRIVAAGHSAIVDAVFADPRERAGLEAMAKSANIPLRGLFLTADLDTRVARVGSRARDASDADASVARAQERYDLGPLEWTAVDASGTSAATLARARAALPQLD